MLHTKGMFDLEDRTAKFASSVRMFIRSVPHTSANIDDCRQLMRSSGSVGANYIEANESLGYRDKVKQIRISLKEAKESAYWLHLMYVGGDDVLESQKALLMKEAKELVLIFSTILKKIGAKKGS